METITVKEVRQFDKGKSGQPYLDKRQRPFVIVSITDENGRKLSGLAYQGSPLLNLKAGDSIEGTVKENTGKDGKTYLNFELPRKDDEVREQMREVRMVMADHERRLKDLELGRGADMGAALKELHKDTDVKPEDLPF